MLLAIMIVHCVASAAHFAHNAVFISDYPNLPPWITAAGVYSSWFAIASIGWVGYLLFRRRHRKTGLFLIVLYAVLGFGGLDHYVVAPMGAHTVAMNATIWFEVATAAVLLVVAVSLLVREFSTRGSPIIR